MDVLAPQRSLARHPLFQVMLAVQNTTPPTLNLPGLHASTTPPALDAAKFDLEFVIEEGQSGSLIGATDLFDPATVMMIAQRYRHVLDAVVAHPRIRLRQIDLLGEAERQAILTEWNATTWPVAAQTLPEMFAAQASDTPDAVALVCENVTLSYAALGAAAQRLADVLVRNGAGPESVVAVAMDRGTDLAITLLAVLIAGAAYLPIDPDHPTARIAFMMADAEVACAVVSAAMRARLERLTVSGDHAGHRGPARVRRAGGPGGHVRCATSREPGLRDLHLGVDGPSQGCHGDARCDREQAGLDAGAIPSGRC